MHISKFNLQSLEEIDKIAIIDCPCVRVHGAMASSTNVTGIWFSFGHVSKKEIWLKDDDGNPKVYIELENPDADSPVYPAVETQIVMMAGNNVSCNQHKVLQYCRTKKEAHEYCAKYIAELYKEANLEISPDTETTS